MSRVSREIIEKNKKSLKKGIHYFGLFGRLCFFGGLLLTIGSFSVVIFNSFVSGIETSALTENIEGMTSGLLLFIEGFLLLTARDAFQSVDALTDEIGEIV